MAMVIGVRAITNIISPHTGRYKIQLKPVENNIRDIESEKGIEVILITSMVLMYG